MIEVESLEPVDLPSAAVVIAASHVTDPAMVWVYPDENRRLHHLTALFRLALADVMLAGQVNVAHTNGRIIGVAAWLPPGGFPVPWRRQLSSAPAFLRLATSTPMATPRLIRFLSASTRAFPGELHWQLNVVGVDPAFQGVGVGTALLADTMAAITDKLHLETWNAANLPFYARFGFHAVATDQPFGPAGPARWTLAHRLTPWS